MARQAVDIPAALETRFAALISVPIPEAIVRLIRIYVRQRELTVFEQTNQRQTVLAVQAKAQQLRNDPDLGPDEPL